MNLVFNACAFMDIQGAFDNTQFDIIEKSAKNKGIATIRLSYLLQYSNMQLGKHYSNKRVSPKPMYVPIPIPQKSIETARN